MRSPTSAEMLPHASAGTAVAPEQPAAPEPVLCQFCDAPATATCPRCGTLYCPAHGGVACDVCSDPASGLPSPLVFRAAIAAFAVGVLLGLYLLIDRPRLSSERAPLDSAPAAAAMSAPTGAGMATGPAPPPAAQAPAAGPAVPTAAVSVQKYAIKPGDTLGAIAAQHGSTIDAIRAANPGINVDSLRVGQEIVIPPGR